MEVFKDHDEIYYTTPRQLKDFLPIDHTLIVDRLEGHANRIRDTWERDYGP